MRFSKWHALGNSYLLVEERIDGRSTDAGRLCDLRYGIGSNGVLDLSGEPRSRSGTRTARCAEFSGNGTRIAAPGCPPRRRRDGDGQAPAAAEYPARIIEGQVEMSLGAGGGRDMETIEATGSGSS